MPFAAVRLKPGVDVEESPSLNAAQISVSNLIRFYSGLVQKRGGWQAMISTPLIGTCSGLHGWADIDGNPYLAAGTEQRLEILIGGALADITPLAATTNPAVSFTTVISTKDVTITDAGYNPAVGDWVNILTQVSVGGLVLFGFYQVTDVPSGTTYTIQAASNAASSVVAGGAVPLYTTTIASAIVTVTLNDHGYADGDTFEALVSTVVDTITISGSYEVTVVDANNFTITASSLGAAGASGSENGGNARIEYLLSSGFAADTATGGYGIGDYGGGDYGLSSGGTRVVPMRQWALDNYGQDLIASPTNGAIYLWVPPSPVPADVIDATAPIYNTWVFVMSQAQIVVALGAETGGVQEPLLIRWSDVGDFTVWTPSSTNQAGSYFVSQGSAIVGGLALGLGAFIWTDIGILQMTYQGLPFVFGVRPIATGCGLIGPRARAVSGAFIMWLSNHGFFLMDIGGGTPAAIECSVWDILINNWDLTQPGQFVLGANDLTNEFELFFPLATTSPYYVAGSVTRGSVKYNFVEKVFDYSITPQLQRTAWQRHWVSSGGNTGNPIGADLASLLQQHEIGYDANGAGMQWSWTTGYFTIAEGEEMSFVDMLIPDFTTLNAPEILVELLVQQTPNQDPLVVGPFQWTPATPWIIGFGARGRQIALRVSGGDVGTFNRLGAFRYRWAPDGRGF